MAELAELGAPVPIPQLSGSADDDWRESGAHELTGYADGAPGRSPGAPASVARGALAVFGACTGVDVLDMRVLSARARSARKQRNAPSSVGGRFRAVPTRDGWVGLSLARTSDIELVPALVEIAVHGDPFEDVRLWAARRTAREVVERFTLLGLPGGVIPNRPVPPSRAGVVATAGAQLPVFDKPTVVDFTSLWAGPLCAHLLGLSGGRVIKVESRRRPDGARRGTQTFFDALHAGHDFRTVDFDTASGRRELYDLVARADVVLEASRPRALAQLGVHAAQHVARGGVWASITAYGRQRPDRVGFGDDVAAAAGLVLFGRDGPYPVGDAIADPLAGVSAAAAVAFALHHRRAALLDVSMFDVAAWAAVT